MFVVMKDGAVWGYYDTRAEAIGAIEEERGKEDGVELIMIDEEEMGPVTHQGYVEVTGEIEEADQGSGNRE